MALYLVQHGKSLPKEVDPDQGLSEEGKAVVARIASVARDYHVNVGQIRHSGKKRALQTAEIFAASLGLSENVKEQSGLKPLDDVSAMAADLNTRDNTMLVGHLPFMERLTSYLITGAPENLVFKFQNGGIVCLDADLEKNAWYIKWTLMPYIG
jgi:phosphohistidine phosphatase